MSFWVEKTRGPLFFLAGLMAIHFFALTSSLFLQNLLRSELVPGEMTRAEHLEIRELLSSLARKLDGGSKDWEK